MTILSTLAPDHLAGLLAGPHAPVLLDVRSPAEYGSARLRGSVNVPLDQLKRQSDQASAHARTAGEEHRATVVVCQSGVRAREAAEVITNAGLADVHVLEGGLARWRTEGNEVENGRAAWEMERQVRLVAGSIVLTSVLASTALPRAKWLAAGIGAGLTGAALTDTCAMGAMLAKAPWNTRSSKPVGLVQALTHRLS